MHWKKIQSAVEELRIAYKLNPQSDSIHRTLATYLLLARKPDEALALSLSKNYGNNSSFT